MSNKSAVPDFDPQRFVSNLTTGPGVYVMYGQHHGKDGHVLYVGKARNLKRRVGSYFNRSGQSPKTERMLSFLQHIEVNLVHTEVEALILENNLIKQYRPPYNIMLRDDKGYPYIHITTDAEWPKVVYHRGSQKAPGRYFGPYPNAKAARDAVTFIQKTFRIRDCEESFFRNRTRPCLQYQIQRCSGPCVERVESADYQQDVQHTLRFLEGKNTEVIEALAGRMNTAAESLEFEKAASLRDTIQGLRKIEQEQNVDGQGGDTDVIVLARASAMVCVVVWFVRNGRQLGHRSYFPQGARDANDAEVLAEFITRYYPGKRVPAELILQAEPEDAVDLQADLSDQAGKKVQFKYRVRGSRAKWLDMAQLTATQALEQRLAMDSDMRKKLSLLQEALELPRLPERIECFDISHSQGEGTVASCVVFDQNGAARSDYRRFNIRDITAGDDYAAIGQAVERRYSRMKKEGASLPDLILIDGGKGQLNRANDVLTQLGVQGPVTVGVAKGVTRRPGLEQLILDSESPPLVLADHSPALHLIQQIRDEAHRFAITGHRQRRDNKRKRSGLEDIPGLGPKRRQALVQYFGGKREVSKAGVEDLCKVDGISRKLAEQIHDYFHS
ncbi:MAG: excinuclease ABC subunit UvrC [Gammaproteobacteria bacterium]|nr:excinuclease ABC subunit UvrC [Gammaproteobacteria bacterium]